MTALALAPRCLLTSRDLETMALDVKIPVLPTLEMDERASAAA